MIETTGIYPSLPMDGLRSTHRKVIKTDDCFNGFYVFQLQPTHHKVIETGDVYKRGSNQMLQLAHRKVIETWRRNRRTASAEL